MLTTPMDVLNTFPIRKTKKQKQVFREAVRTYVTDLGYRYSEEKGSMGAKNVVIGNPDTAEYLITAHYDTPAHLPFPNFITPCNALVFILYQLVLTGLLLLLPMIPAVVLECFTENFDLAYLVWYFLFILEMILMMVGPANKNNANDNTSGVVSVLELARMLPAEHRSKVCFVLFDLEEAGLIGSASYRSKHKKTSEKQIILNLDCVGDGDEIVIFPTAKLRKNKAKLETLRPLAGNRGTKKVTLHEKGFYYCPSDHANFPYGAGIMAFRRGKQIGLYCDKIHTNKDIVLEKENITIITEAIIWLLCN